MKPKVSILMSIYNESESELVKAIQSLTTQTYQNLEIVLIIDNPQEQEKFRKMLAPYLDDNKILVHFNDENIGLASSMNVACNLSSGELIARMDADDVSVSTRIEREVDALQDQQADFVCTGYKLINENDDEVQGKYIHYSPDRLRRSLVTTNCIHHPTVLMKKALFMKAGGYRDFPCSQDYDLWLRLLELDCKFYMIDDALLWYRIRENSTTSQRRFEQACTNFYISTLFYQRIVSSSDDYSVEHHAEFMNKCDHKYKAFKKNIVRIQQLQKNIGHSFLVTVLTRIRLLVWSGFIRDTYFFKLKLKSAASKHFVM